MTRYTEPHQHTSFMARRIDLLIVLEVRRAVGRAMERFHATNPAGYHAQRPAQPICPFTRGCPFTADHQG